MTNMHSGSKRAWDGSHGSEPHKRLREREDVRSPRNRSRTGGRERDRSVDRRESDRRPRHSSDYRAGGRDEHRRSSDYKDRRDDRDRARDRDYHSRRDDGRRSDVRRRTSPAPRDIRPNGSANGRAHVNGHSSTRRDDDEKEEGE